jgi:hypothetical protein
VAAVPDQQCRHLGRLRRPAAGRGYRDIYATTEPPVPGFTPASASGKVDDFLYSAILAATFTY